MGQKVNPTIMRIGITHTWPSMWYAVGDDYKRNLQHDIKIRSYIFSKFKNAGVCEVKMKRTLNKIELSIKAVRLGSIVKKGDGIEEIKKYIKALTSCEVSVNLVEERRPELVASLVGESIAAQIAKRMSFRRVVKSAIRSTMRMGAKGIKVRVSGRLGGAEIAKSEEYKEGKIPLHTLKANIGYEMTEASTTYGKIGIKVWIYTNSRSNLDL